MRPLERVTGAEWSEVPKEVPPPSPEPVKDQKAPLYHGISTVTAGFYICFCGEKFPHMRDMHTHQQVMNDVRIINEREEAEGKTWMRWIRGD